jgi:predicted N-acyltransferase
LKTNIFNSITEVPADIWDALVQGHSCSHSRVFWEVLENSGLNDFRYRYILVSDDAGIPIAIAGFYAVTTDIAIFSPRALRTPLLKVRQIFPNFLKLRMLECGTPITVSSPPFASKDKEMDSRVLSTLGRLLKQIANTEGQLLIVIRDFEPSIQVLQAVLGPLSYHWVDSLPNTYMDIPWNTSEDYIASLKSYYRSKLLKHLRRNRENLVEHKLVTEFHDLAETLSRQWRVVHDQADEFQREVLNSEFYREFSLRLEERSKVLLFYRQGKLVGHALLLLDGELLRWMYFGRNQAGNDSLYIYVAYAVIETAIQLGTRRLELGLTTYSIKQDLGATITPIRLALHSPWRLINPLIALLYPLLNNPPKLMDKRVFKSSHQPTDRQSD